MTTYRRKNQILTEAEGKVIKVTSFKSINRAKRANRGNIQPPTIKPTFAPVVEREDAK